MASDRKHNGGLLNHVEACVERPAEVAMRLEGHLLPPDWACGLKQLDDAHCAVGLLEAARRSIPPGRTGRLTDQ